MLLYDGICTSIHPSSLSDLLHELFTQQCIPSTDSISQYYLVTSREDTSSGLLRYTSARCDSQDLLEGTVRRRRNLKMAHTSSTESLASIQQELVISMSRILSDMLQYMSKRLTP